MKLWFGFGHCNLKDLRLNRSVRFLESASSGLRLAQDSQLYQVDIKNHSKDLKQIKFGTAANRPTTLFGERSNNFRAVAREPSLITQLVTVWKRA